MMAGGENPSYEADAEQLAELDPNTTASLSPPGAKLNKRQKKKMEKAAKEEAAQKAREGVTVIPPKARLGGVPEVPEDDGEILNFAHKHGDRNCRCLRCTCKLCADPEGLTLCGRSEDEKCPICRIINKFVVKQTKELKDEYEETIASMKASHLVDIEKMKQSHKVELQDAMQANNDLDKGLLEARRGEIAQQRKEREKAEKREGMEARIAEIKTALEEKGKAAKVATQTLGERRIVLNNLKRDNLNARRGTGDMGWVDNAKYQQKKNRKHASDT